jgi:autotransporter-associated beta strand protein
LAAQNAVISLSGGGELRFKSTAAATLGGLSGSRDIYLSNENYAAVALTLDVSPGSGEDNPDFSGVLYDAGSVTKTGSGTQILSGNNTYSGGTTVNAGTLVLSGANTFTGDTTVTGGTLRLTHADALQNSTLVTSSSGGFIDFNELSSLNLGGLSGNGNLGAGFSDLALNVGANHADTTYSGILANGGASRLSLTKSGSGTLTLANANPFSGDTTISAGTIALAHAQALQNSILTTADGLSFGTLEAATLGGLSGSGTLALTNSAETPAAVALTLNVGSGAFGEDPTFSGSLTGTGSLTKTGSGTQVLAAQNTFTGTTTVSAGILRLTHADALQNSTLVTTATGTVDFGSLATLNLGGLAGNGALNAPFTSLALNVGANHADTTYSGTLSGAISLTKSGTGTLTLSGANSYSNSDPFFGTTTTIEAGTLAYATRAAFYNGATRANPAVLTGATAAFHVGGPGYFSAADIAAIMSDDNFRTGATLELNTSNATDGAFTLATTLVDGDAGDNILHLTKSGAGTLTLAGTNTYTGATNISGGTLHLTGSAVNSAFTVNSGGTLTGAGATGDLTIAAGATFSPGSSPGLFTVNGDLSLLGTTLMELAADGTRGIAYDAITVTDTITFGGTLTVSLLGDFDPTIGMSFNLFDWTGPSSGVFGTLDLPNLTAGLSWDDTALYTTGTLSITTSAIPEPSTYAALFGACVLGFAAWHKRRRSIPA